MSGRARFLTNLRSMTMEPVFRSRLDPEGYLVPPAYLTADGAAFIDGLSRHRGVVVVDNGRYDDVGRVVARFGTDADRLVTRFREAVDAGSDTTAVRAEVALLARGISAATGPPAPEAPATARLSRRPTAAIGLEDITAATWVRLGLELPLHRDGRSALRRRNQAVASRAAALETGAVGVRQLPVAGAMDHDTARDAGRAFARAGLTGAAIGFGAYMADDSYVTQYKRDGHWHPLPARMPQRYLRTVLVAAGFWAGWADVTGGGPERFHFLGLGAPIMIGLVSLVAAETPHLTFDATSPMQDAAQGTLYVLEPAYLKLRTRRIADELVSGRSPDWPCRCPFCRDFVDRHPFDLAAGLAWARARPGAPVTAADLRGGGGLHDALPLLAEPTRGPLRSELDRARSGHNHWVLQRAVAAVDRRSGDRAALEAHLASVVGDYATATNAPSFAAAVRLAFDLARVDPVTAGSGSRLPA